VRSGGLQLSVFRHRVHSSDPCARRDLLASAAAESRRVCDGGLRRRGLDRVAHLGASLLPGGLPRLPRARGDRTHVARARVRDARRDDRDAPHGDVRAVVLDRLIDVPSGADNGLSRRSTNTVSAAVVRVTRTWAASGPPKRDRTVRTHGRTSAIPITAPSIAERARPSTILARARAPAQHTARATSSCGRAYGVTRNDAAARTATISRGRNWRRGSSATNRISVATAAATPAAEGRPRTIASAESVPRSRSARSC